MSALGPQETFTGPGHAALQLSDSCHSPQTEILRFYTPQPFQVQLSLGPAHLVDPAGADGQVKRFGQVGQQIFDGDGLEQRAKLTTESWLGRR